MPRIRTFKPEFFRSPDTAKASPKARLLYMAMWSWADDEGVGETNLYGLLGFAFPDEDGLSVKEIQSLLTEVRGSFGVVFYEHHGRFYYAIPSWDSHQKTERRANARHPKPSDPDSYPDLRFGASSDTQGNSDDIECGSALGTGEQGNIGNGNSGGSGSQVCHQGADDVAPPDKCPKHINTAIPPSCGGCADARRNYQAWKKRQVKAEADELDVKRVERLNRRTAIDNCNLCDENGMVSGFGGLKHCTHQEEAHA